MYEFCTEVNHKGRIFRAHPNYRHQGQWYDFVNIKYEIEDHVFPENSTKEFIFPAKIKGFFRFKHEINIDFSVLVRSSQMQK